MFTFSELAKNADSLAQEGLSLLSYEERSSYLEFLAKKPTEPYELSMWGFSGLIWNFLFVYKVLYPKISDEIEKDFLEAEKLQVEIDVDPIGAGLDKLIGKVAVCREYENRLSILLTKAMKFRSAISRFLDPLVRQASYMEDEAIAHVSLAISEDEKVSAKERSSRAGRGLVFSKEVVGKWKSFLEEVKTFEAIISEKKKTMAATRSDLLTQVAGVKVHQSVHPNALSGIPTAPPTLGRIEKYPENPEQEGPVEIGPSYFLHGRGAGGSS